MYVCAGGLVKYIRNARQLLKDSKEGEAALFLVRLRGRPAMFCSSWQYAGRHLPVPQGWWHAWKANLSKPAQHCYKALAGWVDSRHRQGLSGSLNWLRHTLFGLPALQA